MANSFAHYSNQTLTLDKFGSFKNQEDALFGNFIYSHLDSKLELSQSVWKFLKFLKCNYNLSKMDFQDF